MSRRIGYIGALRNFTMIYEFIGEGWTRMSYFSSRAKLLDFISQNPLIVVRGIYWRSNFKKNIMDRYL